MRNRGLQVALLLAAFGVSRAAGATAESSQSGVQKSTVVRYSAEDLNSDSGAAHLYSMLAHAARFVCDDTGTDKELWVLTEIRHCEQEAIANAVSTVSSASLTSEYNKHYRNQPLIERARLSQRSGAIIPVVG